MGLFDDFGATFKGLADQVDASDLPRFLDVALQKSQVGSLQTVVDGLAQIGMADRVASWVDRRIPMTSDDVLKALGRDNIDRLSRTVGLTPDSTMALLADKLPETFKAASDVGRLTLPRALVR